MGRSARPGSTRRTLSSAGSIDLANRLLGSPRHLSQHVGGFVLSRGRLDETVPIGNAAMEDRTFVEWDKDDLDALGLMKVDVLGLGMLTCIRKSFELLAAHCGIDHSLASVPKEDPAVYAMLQRADSIGVFQVELRAQMSMLPRLKPKAFYDLVIEVAIVRPGPIQGNMVHPYLRRREGREAVHYPSPVARARAGERTATGARQDSRRAALPGAGDEDRHGGGEVHAGGGERASPRHGDLPPYRHHPHLRGEAGRGHGQARLQARLRRTLLRPDQGLRRIRLSREPRRLLRQARLRLGLDQMPPPGGLRRGAAQFPADGLLRPGADRARRPRARRRGARRRRQFQPVGQHAGGTGRRGARLAAGLPPGRRLP